MTLTEDIQHNLGICNTMAELKASDAERQRLQKDYDEYLASGKTVKELPPGVRTEGYATFNNQGDLNPAKKRRWDNSNLAKNYKK